MRARWIVVAILAAIAAFAIVAGGLLWPRPQFRQGPWAGPDSAAVSAPPAPTGPDRD